MCAEHMQGLEGNAFWAVHVLLRAERKTNNVHVRVLYKHIVSILSFKYSVYMYVHVRVHCTGNVQCICTQCCYCMYIYGVHSCMYTVYVNHIQCIIFCGSSKTPG